MRLAHAVIVLAAISAFSLARADEPTFSFPLIQGYGGVVTLPQATEQPRNGAKVVFSTSRLRANLMR